MKTRKSIVWVMLALFIFSLSFIAIHAYKDGEKEYVISNIRTDKGCLYYTLVLGSWKDENREVSCILGEHIETMGFELKRINIILSHSYSVNEELNNEGILVNASTIIYNKKEEEVLTIKKASRYVLFDIVRLNEMAENDAINTNKILTYKDENVEEEKAIDGSEVTITES